MLEQDFLCHLLDAIQPCIQPDSSEPTGRHGSTVVTAAASDGFLLGTSRIPILLDLHALASAYCEELV